MKLCIKNIVAFLVLAMGVTLFYNIVVEPSIDSASIELSIGNDAISDHANNDYDANEKEKITAIKLYIISLNRVINPIYFYITCRAKQPSLSVWQPPKLN